MMATGMPTSRFGIQVGSARADALDEAALDFISQSRKSVTALEIGCGVGAQSVRMARAGANVLANDIEDYGAEISRRAEESGMSAKLNFIQADARKLVAGLEEPIDVLFCQRSIHYMPYADALTLLRTGRRLMRSCCRLFISFSGLESELGTQYPAGDVPVFSRLYLLSEKQRDTHQILAPICLYRAEEAVELVSGANFKILKCWTSDFGNVKVIAEPTLENI